MERDKALEMAKAQIEKQFGKGSIMRMGEKTTMTVEAIPTGALAVLLLDLAEFHLEGLVSFHGGTLLWVADAAI